MVVTTSGGGPIARRAREPLPLSDVLSLPGHIRRHQGPKQLPEILAPQTQQLMDDSEGSYELGHTRLGLLCGAFTTHSISHRRCRRSAGRGASALASASLISDMRASAAVSC
jgi:hypothetical protein